MSILMYLENCYSLTLEENSAALQTLAKLKKKGNA